MSIIRSYERFIKEGVSADSKVSEAHQETQYYMFFGNLENMKRKIENLLSKDHEEIDNILRNGHDWAADHIAAATENLTQVEDFLLGELEEEGKGKIPDNTIMITKPISTITKKDIQV
jgi:uncharacterized protein YktB (UPF0637 family)